MKFSELPLDSKATIRSVKAPSYVFSGIVRKDKADRLWLTKDGEIGYIISPEYDAEWTVEYVNTGTKRL